MEVMMAGRACPTREHLTNRRAGCARRGIFKQKSASWCVFSIRFLLLFLFAAVPAVAGDDMRGNPAARLLTGKSASEHWEFTARFDSGHFLFVEFLITNIGIGDQNAAAIGHLVTPDGQTRRFANGRRKGQWTLSPDRLRITVGTSTLDLHAPTYQIQINKQNVRVDLHFSPKGAAVWSNTFVPAGYSFDLLAAAVPVDGSLWVKGMAAPVTVHGTLASTHSWMNEAGNSLVLRRLEFFTLQENLPLYGVDFTTPTGKRVRWVVLTQPGEKRYESGTFDLALDGQTSAPADQGYPMPAFVRLKNSELDSQFQSDRLLVSDDPFSSLPQVFRFLVETALNLRPRNLWASSPFAVSLQTPLSAVSGQVQIASQVRGTGVTAATFLNPLPTSLSTAATEVLKVSRASQRSHQPAGRP
jgi:hypothetical protein